MLNAIQIEQKVLSAAAQKVINVVSNRSLMPILSNILLEAKDNSLRLCATDLDVSISTKVVTVMEEQCTITVNARKFAEILKELPSSLITIEFADNRLNILSNTGRYSLAGLSAEEFPILPSFDGVSINLDGEEFVDMIKKTTFAASTDESRPALTGILVRAQEQKLSAVATDGRRLAMIHKDVSLPLADFNAIIHPKVLTHLTRLVSGGESLNEIIIGENNIKFDLGDTELYARLIEGPYPMIDAILPKNNEKKMVVSTENLTGAIRRVAALSDADTHLVHFSISKDMLKLSSLSQDMGGEANEEIDIEYDSESLDVGYNAEYLLDILRRINSEKVMFELDSSENAGLIKPVEQQESEEYLCLIMPLRLNK